MQSAPALRIGVAMRGAGDDSPVLFGARLGVEEANRSVALFGGGAVELVVGSLDEVLSRGVVALMTTDGSTDGCLRCADRAGQRGALFFNTTCPDDTLRGDQCRASAFHVAPSRTMLDAALHEARAHGSAPLPDGATATAWDPALERFGADTLNRRYRDRYHASMSSWAWCGWFAVKCAWEAALRSKASDGAALIAYLERPTTRFDGHKGSPLYFDASHRLVQPLYDGAGGDIAKPPIPARCELR